MDLFRIYVEDRRGPEASLEIADEYFDSHTWYRAEGTWRRKRENTMVLEIITEPERAGDVLRVAERLKALHGQEAVLVTRQCVGTMLIEEE